MHFKLMNLLWALYTPRPCQTQISPVRSRFRSLVREREADEAVLIIHPRGSKMRRKLYKSWTTLPDLHDRQAGPYTMRTVQKARTLNILYIPVYQVYTTHLHWHRGWTGDKFVGGGAASQDILYYDPL